MAEPSKSPPAREEFELTLLGKGTGESCVVHLGLDRWMIVDSFLEPEPVDQPLIGLRRLGHKRTPAAAKYLEGLYAGSDRELVVETIVITHLHSDHYQGVRGLHQLYKDARLVVPVPLGIDKLVKMLVDKAPKPLAAVAQTISDAAERKLGPSGHARNGILYAHSGQAIPTAGNAVVVAIAPQHAATSVFRNDLATTVKGGDLADIRNHLEEENCTSIALHVTACGSTAILGGDVEVEPDDLGWPAVVDDQTNLDRARAAIVKVAHHGSITGFHLPMWHNLVETEAPMLVAPFWSHTLPKRDHQLLHTALGGPLWQAATSGSELDADHQSMAKQTAGTGVVQARRQPGGDWQIGTSGPAHEVKA